MKEGLCGDKMVKVSSEGIGVLCIGVVAFVSLAYFSFWWAKRILDEIKKDEDYLKMTEVYEDENHTIIPINDIPERHL